MMHTEIYQKPVGSDQILIIQKSLRESGCLHTGDVAHGMSPDQHNRFFTDELLGPSRLLTKPPLDCIQSGRRSMQFPPDRS